MKFSNSYGGAIPSDDLTIWRFVSIEEIFSILVRRRLFIKRVFFFRDPYEGYRSKKYYDFLKRRIESSQKLLIDNSEEGIKQVLGNFKTAQKNALKTHYASCWHANEHESAAMWDAYSNIGVVVAIKTNVKNLKESLQENRQIYSNIGMVKYIDYESGEESTSIAESSSIYQKRRSFEHEKELRLTVLDLMSSILEDHQLSIGAELHVSPEILIEEIYLHPDSEDFFVETMKETFKKLGYSDIQVRKSALYQLS
ncbi:MAG: DUF2971 domain-containing protein [Pseudomonadota bacterium]